MSFNIEQQVSDWLTEVVERLFPDGAGMSAPLMPVFTPEQINAHLLDLWDNKAPQIQKLNGINRSVLRNADRSIWISPDGIKLRAVLDCHHMEFVWSLMNSFDQSDIAKACTVYSLKVDKWIVDLQDFTLHQPTGKTTRDATGLEVKHRRRGMTYRDNLKHLGYNADISTLMEVGDSLTRLWCLRHIDSDNL